LLYKFKIKNANINNLHWHYNFNFRKWPYFVNSTAVPFSSTVTFVFLESTLIPPFPIDIDVLVPSVSLGASGAGVGLAGDDTGGVAAGIGGGGTSLLQDMHSVIENMPRAVNNFFIFLMVFVSI